MSYSANLSAVKAASLSQQVTANDVANMNTPGYKSKRVDLESGPEGQGVRPAAIRENTKPGPAVEQIQTSRNEQGQVRQEEVRVEGSNTDIAEETVQMIEDEAYLRSNTEAISSHFRATGSVLNILV